MSQPRITRIMVQSCPRMDSITALYLLTRTKEGEKKYPGVETAKVEFWGTGTASPDGMSWKDYLEKGTILIGVGGGPFDEHPSEEFGDGKTDRLSATLLVARDLGLDKLRLFRTLIKTTTDNDLNLIKGADNLANVVKLMHRMEDGNPHKVIQWAFDAIDAILNSQLLFISATKEFDQGASVEEIDGPDGTKCRVALVRSDNCQMALAAKYRDNRLAVLVQMRRSGAVQIFGTQALGVRMDKITQAIRCAELGARGNREVVDPDSLLLPGQLPIVPQWCYQMPGGNLLNGSETAPNVGTTRLKIGKIMQIVLDHVYFEKVEAKAPTKAEASV